MISPEVMRDKADSKATIITKFILHRNDYNNVFVFYEGTDDSKFYFQYIKNFLCKFKKKYQNFICKSKENVIEIHKKILELDKDATTIFFVDRDYDINENVHEDIYVSPTYSIVNLYVPDQAIDNFLIHEMGISFDDSNDNMDFKKAFSFLVDKRNKMIEDILFGNACYSLQRKKMLEINCIESGFNALKTFDEIKEIKTLNDFNNKMQYMLIEEEEVEVEYNRLKESPERLIRGKYLLEKMPKCINEICSIMCEKNNGFSKKRKMRIVTSEKTLLRDLSIYAELPDDLEPYLESRFRK